jgi:hypothetical protein
MCTATTAKRSEHCRGHIWDGLVGGGEYNKFECVMMNDMIDIIMMNDNYRKYTIVDKVSSKGIVESVL